MRNFDLDEVQEYLNNTPPGAYPPPEESVPESDFHFELMTCLAQCLQDYFYEQRDSVAIHADHAWFATKGDKSDWRSPDVLIAFGRPQMRRDSYCVWLEDNISPQVIFEIGSRSNTAKEILKKRDWYELNGVEEFYWIEHLTQRLRVYVRKKKKLVEQTDIEEWTSKRLGLRMTWDDKTFRAFLPNGDELRPMNEQLRAEREAREEAEAKARAETEAREEAEAEAEVERKARKKAEKASKDSHSQLDALRAKLRQLGIDPDSV